MIDNSQIGTRDGLNIVSHNRKSPYRRLAGVVVLAGVFLLPTLVWSQAPKRGGKPPEPDNSGQPKVNIGVSTAKPGDIIDIPLTLSAPDTVKVGSIVETIGFPKNTLSLNKAELGLAGEQSKAEIKTDVKDDGASPDQSDLQVTISSADALKPGILAYLKFKVSTDAKKGTVVLKTVDSKLVPAGGGTLDAAKGKDGEVTIFNLDEEIPIVGCFFFSH